MLLAVFLVANVDMIEKNVYKKISFSSHKEYVFLSAHLLQQQNLYVHKLLALSPEFVPSLDFQQVNQKGQFVSNGKQF